MQANLANFHKLVEFYTIKIKIQLFFVPAKFIL